MKCGREKDGNKADELGICPVYPDDGRDCWNLAGTFCGQGTGNGGPEEEYMPDL